MANPVQIKDEAFSTFEASAANEENVNLLESARDFTILHLGINSAFVADDNLIFLSYGEADPDGATGLKKIILKSGMAVTVGPENGPIALEYKANGGAPLFAIMAGQLYED
jgi:hypothetical protein